MFEDSLVESTGKLRSGRTKYTTLLSFLLQCALIGVLVLIPLIYTEALPAKAMLTTLVAPPPPPPPPPPPTPQVQVVKKVSTDIIDGALRTPTKIPDKIKKIVEEEAPPPVTSTMGVVGGVGTPGGSAGGVLGGILASANSAAPKIEVKRLRVSQGVQASKLISQPKPNYPPIAKQARVQGQVVLQAVISKNGTIENLKVVSGHPMLTQAALDAVRNWRYQPTVLNGEPVEVETTINVNFSLTGG
jgi:protein TonB